MSAPRAVGVRAPYPTVPAPVRMWVEATKPGTYHIYCSLHDEMKMTIRVVR